MSIPIVLVSRFVLLSIIVSWDISLPSDSRFVGLITPGVYSGSVGNTSGSSGVAIKGVPTINSEIG